MQRNSTIYIDFSELGYPGYYPVDRYWMNFQYSVAEDWYENTTDIDLLVTDIQADRLELIVRSVGNEMDTNWLGHALVNIAMYGLVGLKAPEFYHKFE
jgi:hypothetical protein